MKLNGLIAVWFVCVIISGCKPKIEFAQAEPTHHYKVILMSGQSNMVGKGRMADLEKMVFENIAYQNYGMTTDLEISKNTFGPEIGISKVLGVALPNERFLLFKYGINGASLWNYSPNFSEQKANDTGHPEFGNMYDSLLCKIKNIRGGEIIAFCWMQGEADARIPEAGEEYQENLKMLIDSLRKDLNKPELPILIGLINPPKTTYPFADTVRNVQKMISQNDSNIYLIDTDDIEKWQDGLHYSSDGQLILGERFGLKIVNLLKD